MSGEFPEQSGPQLGETSPMAGVSPSAQPTSRKGSNPSLTFQGRDTAPKVQQTRSGWAIGGHSTYAFGGVMSLGRGSGTIAISLAFRVAPGGYIHCTP
jgi:hypothetical protein